MKNLYITLLVFWIMFLGLTGCQSEFKQKIYGWTISADVASATLSLSSDSLGIVVDQIHLNFQDGNNLVALSDWTISEQNGTVTIETKAPRKSKWNFLVSDSTINVSCSNANGFITGIAPAGRQRIPARTKDQDNDVIYTQMGYISATNIFKLFDMQKDIMIAFAKGSKLKRNQSDNQLMNIRIPVSEDIEIALDKNYYTNILRTSRPRNTDPEDSVRFSPDYKGFRTVYKPIRDHFNTAPVGWSSWYCYYMSADQKNLMAETSALAEKLKPYGLEYVQLDAAYTRGEQSNWLEWNKEMYPNGGKYWFDYVHKVGLKPGIWMNAYGANVAKPAMADKYPDNFYLRDADGNLARACCGADQTVVRLDCTNPEVLEKHLKPMFDILVNDWGLNYIKAGGWGDWMNHYENNRERAFDPHQDSRESYRNVLKVIREALGEDNYMLGCAFREIGVGFDMFDGVRTGGDTWGHWNWRPDNRFDSNDNGMQYFFKALFGHNWLNGICLWSDPDDVMLRDPITMEEAKTIVSSVSVTGQSYFISDFIADFSKERLHDFLNSPYNIGWAKTFPEKVKALPHDRLELYHKTMPTMPIRAVDLFPFKTIAKFVPQLKSFPKAVDLKVNSVAGVYDVVTLYNWENTNGVKVLDFQKDLGLESGNNYLVFDFWAQQLLGIFDSTIEQNVPMHGTKALIIKAIAEYPQLLATSRHLSVAYGIQKLTWNPEAKMLEGFSQAVPGDPYTLFIHVPTSFEFDQYQINAENIIHKMNPNNILEITFTGNEKPVRWLIKFN